MSTSLLQYLKIGGSVLIAVVALTQIWDWVTEPNSPSIKLRAKVWYNYSTMPDFIDNWVRDLSALPDSFIAYRDLLSISKPGNLSGDTFREAHQKNFASLVNRYLEPNLNRNAANTYGSIYGYWYASIANEGEKALKSVKLLLPNAFYADVYPEVQEHYGAWINGSIDVWELQPGERMEVWAWTPSYPEPQDFKRVRLSHSEGLGVVEIWKEPSATSEWLSRHRLVTILLMALLCAISFFCGSVVAIRRNGLWTIFRAGKVQK